MSSRYLMGQRLPLSRQSLSLPRVGECFKDEEPVMGETSPGSLYMGAVEGSALSMCGGFTTTDPVHHGYLCSRASGCVCLSVCVCLSQGCPRLGSSGRAEEIPEPGTMERPLLRGGGLL